MIAADTMEPVPPRHETERTIVLVRSALGGDGRAFGELYDQYGGLVHAVVLANAPPEDAEDLVQESFIAAWRGLGSLRDPATFGSWIASIARNAARKRRRGTLKLVPLDENLPAEGTEPAIDGARALAAIRSLPEAYRETLLLRLVEGMSGPEIAERTGLTHGSVRVNLHRGMQLLRAELGWTP
jgi:RNA polymerase sigma-70 factor (ECF subfamily)